MVEGGSFNILDEEAALKADIFVLAESLLDRRQIERRIPVTLPGASTPIWVTAPEDQVLRKLEWFRLGGETSERQWQDVVGILRVNASSLDGPDLLAASQTSGLHDLLVRALDDAGADLAGR